jgi:hypothetical protein
MGFVMKEAKAMAREMRMSLDDWRELARSAGWQVVRDRQEHFAFQIASVRERIDSGKGKVDFDEYCDMQRALNEALKVNLEAPDLSAELKEFFRARIPVLEQMNANIRDKIAIWRWRRGEFDA